MGQEDCSENKSAAQSLSTIEHIAMMYKPSDKTIKYMDEIDKWLTIDEEAGSFVLKSDAPEDIKEKYKFVKKEMAKSEALKSLSLSNKLSAVIRYNSYYGPLTPSPESVVMQKEDLDETLIITDVHSYFYISFSDAYKMQCRSGSL